MNRRELLLDTLHRVTGQPMAHLKKVVETYVSATPDERTHLWEEDLQADEQIHLQEMFEKEASGILARYVEILMVSDEMRQDRIQCIQQENSKKFRKGRRS